VLCQTAPVLEILVCDDGSTDDSRLMVSSLGNSRVKWLDCGRNGMPSIPRNKGIAAAKGDWVAFLDSDDEWLPNKIEVQLQALKQSNSQACSTNAFCIRGDVGNDLVHSKDHRVLRFEDLLHDNRNICSSVIVRRTVLEEVSNFPEEKELKGIEDYELWLRLTLATNFYYIHKPLLKYYDFPTTSIRSEIPLTVWQLRVIVFRSLFQWIRSYNRRLTLRQEIVFRKNYVDALRRTGISYPDIAREMMAGPRR
jgi:glycosyltransferase involved in cell wall biosynthesis